MTGKQSIHPGRPAGVFVFSATRRAGASQDRWRATVVRPRSPIMPNLALSTVVSRVGRAALSDRAEDTDGRLLARFVQTREEAAFGELVRRLGPMVLGVCRRVSGDAHL